MKKLNISRIVLASMTDEEPAEHFSDIGDEVLQAALARTIARVLLNLRRTA